jgi:hypothetical protein
VRHGASHRIAVARRRCPPRELSPQSARARRLQRSRLAQPQQINLYSYRGGTALGTTARPSRNACRRRRSPSPCRANRRGRHHARPGRSTKFLSWQGQQTRAIAASSAHVLSPMPGRRRSACSCRSRHLLVLWTGNWARARFSASKSTRSWRFCSSIARSVAGGSSSRLNCNFALFLCATS